MSASTMIVRMTKPSRRYAVTMCLENFLPSILGARRPRFSNDAHFETAGIDVDDDIAGMFGIVASGSGAGDEAFACIAAMFVCGIGEAGLAAIAGAAAIGAATIGGGVVACGRRAGSAGITWFVGVGVGTGSLATAALPCMIGAGVEYAGALGVE